MLKTTLLILLVALCLAAFRGNIADWLWPTSVAPWEDVDAFYYPQSASVPSDDRKYGLASVDSCRRWVLSQAALRGDSKLEMTDYECGIGYVQNVGDLRKYRLILR